MIKTILYVVGIILSILSLSMLVPAFVDLVNNDDDWIVFISSSTLTLYVGGTCYFSTKGYTHRIGRREAFLITATSWAAIGAFGSLPLIFSSLDITVTDAVFETISGLTTTGSTVLIGLDDMAPGLLLWRSLLQWIGGIGIIVMAIFLFPLLRVGGMQLFRSESSDISDKVAPRVYEIARLTVLIYASLTAACAIALQFAGMTFFDAVNHAFTTLATGGYSTKDASIGFYNSLSIEIILMVFMTLGAMPLVFYAGLMKNPERAMKGEAQIPVFLTILVMSIVLMTAWRVSAADMNLWGALRESAFNVTSILTDTGYATTDFSTWGTGAQAMFMCLMFVGGCAGSTAGAIKIFRWQILFRSLLAQLKKMIAPNRIVPTRYRGQTVNTEMVESVKNFFFMYLMTWAIISVGLMVNGLDILSAISAVAQAMANAGPGLGPIVGPGTNFASIPDFSKWLLCMAMVLGRLELTTIFVLLLPDYWSK